MSPSSPSQLGREEGDFRFQESLLGPEEEKEEERGGRCDLEDANCLLLFRHRHCRVISRSRSSPLARVPSFPPSLFTRGKLQACRYEEGETGSAAGGRRSGLQASTTLVALKLALKGRSREGLFAGEPEPFMLSRICIRTL